MFRLSSAERLVPAGRTMPATCRMLVRCRPGLAAECGWRNPQRSGSEAATKWKRSGSTVEGADSGTEQTGTTGQSVLLFLIRSQ